MSEKKDEKSKSPSIGRPMKNDDRVIPWEEIDKLLVYGEPIDTEFGPVTDYPSQRQIADRFGMSHGLVGRYSRAHHCMRRRSKHEDKVKEMASMKLAELRSEAVALQKDDIVRTIDRFLAKFEQAFLEDRVRCDNPTDYNTLARLRAFIIGDADARHELIGDISLEDLEKFHKKSSRDFKETSPEVRGEVITLDKERKKKEKSNGEG